MKRRPFLWEIGCEEIPASWLPRLIEGFGKLVEKELSETELRPGNVGAFGTLRRLVVHVPKLVDEQVDRTEQVTGPPLKIARDDQGAWTRAALGFAAKSSVAPSELAVVSTPKGDYVGFEKKTKGRKTAELLPEIMAKVLRGLSFPKFMHWDAELDDGTPLPFGRPIRWMVSLYDGKVVPFQIRVLGSPNVVSGRKTRGHRFLAPKGQRAGRPFAVANFDELKSKLKQHYVVVDPFERRERLLKILSKLEAKAHAERAPGLDPALVADLVEWPGAVLGAYPEPFLSLPEEVRHTVLIHHQHYFPLAKTAGFIAPTNMASDPKGNIKQGAERVVVARLRDAKFFWDDDLGVLLAEREDALEGVLFHAKLGSYRAKKERTVPLAAAIAAKSGAREAPVRRAATLAKCDLVTGMVGEFPELQGIMGGLYAKEQGEPEPVWKAIYSHYEPMGLGDDDGFPLNREGVVVSLADKLDTLASMFSVGVVPTGSRDPFGLRRSALGILRLLLESGERLSFPIDLTLKELLSEAVQDEDALAKLSDFLVERLRFVFSRTYRYDEINAVFALGALDRPVTDIERRLGAIAALRGSDDFQALSVAIKRVGNILAGASPGSVDPAKFFEKEEIDLFTALERVEPDARKQIVASRYEDALRTLSSLRPHVDRFFDEVLVMAEDEELRANRLALLHRLRTLFSEVAELSEIVPGDGI
jgi:glycyl-tRNA synthetase beta chain